MSPYGKAQQIERLKLAKKMFISGRDIPFVKKITGLTLAALKRAGMIYEIIIPDPAGYVIDSNGDHVHNGQMKCTGQWRPSSKAA